MIKLLYVIPIILLLGYYSNVVYGEVTEEGSDYKIESTGNPNESTWTSKTPQIFDGTQWINYRYSDNPSYIQFESMGSTIIFDKNTCAFKTYEKGILNLNRPIIQSLSYTLKRDGIDVVDPTCDVTQSIPVDNGITFDAIRSDGKSKLVIHYNIDYSTGIEETYEPENLDTSSSTLSITASCYKCNPIKVQGDLIYLTKNFVINTENSIHGTVSEQTKSGDDYYIKYETTLQPDTKSTIDPTYGWTSGQSLTAYTTATTGTSCGNPPEILQFISPLIEIPPSTSSAICYTTASQFPLTGIPSSSLSVSDSKLIFSVSSSTNGINCNITKLDNLLERYFLSDNNTGLWRDIHNGTTYVDNSTSCASLDWKTVDLGATADTDVQSAVTTGRNAFGIGLHAKSETRNGATHTTEFGEETIQLQITYTSAPYTPKNPIAVTQSATQINLSWTNKPTPTHFFVTDWGLNSILSMAVNSTGHIFETNGTDDTVVIYKDVYRQTPLDTFGGSGSGNGQFSTPFGIKINSTNYIYVVDIGNQRIQIFDKGGNYKSQFSTGSDYPAFITLDNSNHVYAVVTADFVNYFIKKYNLSGTVIDTATPSYGETIGGIDYDDNNNNLYISITDSNAYGNNGIEIFDSNLNSIGNLVRATDTTSPIVYYPVDVIVDEITNSTFVLDGGLNGIGTSLVYDLNTTKSFFYNIGTTNVNPPVNGTSIDSTILRSISQNSTHLFLLQHNYSWPLQGILIVNKTYSGDSISGYKIERESPIGDGFSTIVADTGTTTMSYSDTSVTQNKTYNYRVSSVNPTAASNPSSQFNAKTAAGSPYPPTGLIASTISSSIIDLSWVHPSNDGGSAITGYKIERESPVGGGWGTIVADTGNTLTTYSNTGLTASTQYNYRVSAINALGTSTVSNSADATTTEAGKPPPPTGLSAITITNQRIDLSWTAPVGNHNINGYRIFRESPIGGGWSTLVSNTTTTITTYSNTGLTQNTQYNYKVASINGTGVGSNSTADDATTYGPPSAPLALTATATSWDKILLDWNTPSSNNGATITGYKIFRESPIGGGFTTIVTNTGNTITLYLNTGLSASTQYNYKVAAINTYGAGTNSTAANDTTDPPIPPDAPVNLNAVSAFQQINLDWDDGSSNGGASLLWYGIRFDNNTNPTGWITLVANSSIPNPREYQHTGLHSGITQTYQVRHGTIAGWSNWSNNATGSAIEPLDADVLFTFTNKTGDAYELRQSIRLNTGSPDPTITNIKILKNGTAINNTNTSISITRLETKQLGRSFVEQLDSDFIYNITSVISIQNATSTYTFKNSTYIQPVYTANYHTSIQGNLQYNFTHQRLNSFQDLNLVVNRQDLPANTECLFKTNLFEDGEWHNQTNSGWYNLTIGVDPTKAIYFSCYNDLLIFNGVSYGAGNATLAFVNYFNQLGTFAGVPIPFLFIILLAAVFTGRSAITGIIFVTITIGVMGVMGYLPDINGDPAITAPTWGLVIFLCGLGIFIGKRYF